MGAFQSEPMTELATLVQELTNASKSFSQVPGPEGYRSRVEIISKAKEIINAVRGPQDLAFSQSNTLHEMMAIRTLLSLNVLKKIPDQGSITLSALSRATEVQDSLLERLVRAVAGTGFVRQISNHEYSHTKFSRAYATTTGPGLYFETMYDGFLSLDRFHEYLTDRGTPCEPDDPAFNPYTWTHKQDGTMFYDIMAQHPEQLQKFQTVLENMEKRKPLDAFYNFGQLATTETRAVLVDVGGGTGKMIKQIMQAHPELARTPEKLVLEDMEETIQRARKAGVVPEGVRMIAHDFFTEQPVKGAKAYYLRRVLHNWSDTKCIAILKPLAEAMSADSVLLVSDMVMPARCGEADLLAVTMDLGMLKLGGKERTEAGFTKILEPAGLELVKVWRAPFGADALVEARLTRAGSQASWRTLDEASILTHQHIVSSVQGGLSTRAVS
ncbi:hypothetical protein MMC18_008211 [Xylographa bjoerkii]|nr:hypothetical protein [Xylographa bjoerkii]